MFTRKADDAATTAAARRRLAALAASLEGRVARPDAPPGADRGGPGPSHRRPEPVGARWAVTPNHAAVIALVVAVLVALAAWWALRGTPQTHPVHVGANRFLPSTATAGVPAGGVPAGGVPSTVAGTGITAAAPTQPSATAPLGVASGGSATQIIVDVAGKVRHPGIVELPAGSRVVDALTAAGGVRPHVNTIALNLARLLVDGEQIVVGVHVPTVPTAPAALPTTAATSTDSAIAAVNLNTASEAELETLPGVGPVTAQAILTYRTENGGFSTVDQLLDVSGIGDVTLANLRPYVFV